MLQHGSSDWMTLRLQPASWEEVSWSVSARATLILLGHQSDHMRAAAAGATAGMCRPAIRSSRTHRWLAIAHEILPADIRTAIQFCCPHVLHRSHCLPTMLHCCFPAGSTVIDIKATSYMQILNAYCWTDRQQLTEGFFSSPLY